jgi:predicted dehydrogenase
MNDASKVITDGTQSAGKTRVCVVGLGHWGPNIVRAIESHSEAVVVCAAEQSEQRQAQVRERIPSLPIEPSFQDCLRKHQFEAVVIAVPTELHFQLGMQALEAGKHVMIEKPLALNSQEAIELCNEAEAKKKMLMTGHIFLYNEGIRACQEIVKKGELGKLLYIHSIRTNLGPLRNDVNALWDLASHDIAIFNHIFDAMPIRVSCSAYHLLGRPVEDIAQGSLFYPGNRVATFFVSWLDPQKKREVTIVGDRRMLTFDDMKPERPLKMYDKGVTVRQDSDFSDSFHSFRLSIREGLCTEPEVSTGAPLRNECVHFIDCVRTGTRPLTDGVDGLNVVRVLEALSRSAMERGAPVSVRYSESASDREEARVYKTNQPGEVTRS